MSISCNQLENRGAVSAVDKEMGVDLSSDGHPSDSFSEHMLRKDWNVEVRWDNHSSSETLPLSSKDVDQNFHRESVVCHSDARGVVHYGSSSLETAFDSSYKLHESFIEVPSNCDQYQIFEPDPSIPQSENYLLQNSSVQRPRVIVAKREKCL